MMEDLHVEPDSIATYAGLVSATFSLCQSVTGLAWGRVSDGYGRKPTILAGMLCLVISTALFGLSRSIVWAMLTRGLAGLSSGNVGIIRTMVAELVPQRDLQPRAFSIMPLIWTVGSIFGPTLGGTLAHPARTYPDLVGEDGFLAHFPYALPNLLASGFLFLGFVVGVLFLRETLETQRHRRDPGLVLGKMLMNSVGGRKEGQSARPPASDEATRLLDDGPTGSEVGSSYGGASAGDANADSDSDSDAAADRRGPDVISSSSPPSGHGRVFTRQASINLVVYTFLALHSVASDQLLPVFMHHRRQERAGNGRVQLPFRFAGGFGMSSQEIGLLFTVYGTMGMLTQFFVFPVLARRFGILGCLKGAAVAFPMVYVLTPFSALAEEATMQKVLISSLMSVKSVATMFAFPCSSILLTNSASSVKVLGTLNGVGTSISALGRALGPALGGWTFSWGVAAGYVIVPWWTMAFLALVGSVPIWFLTETDGFGDRDGR